MPETGTFHSLWIDTAPQPPHRWAQATGDIDADVVIIGAGITGLSTAWHLVNAGQRVVVLEAEKVGRGTTGSSTGNLYVTVGSGLQAIERKHGQDTLRSVVAVRAAAIDFIEACVTEHRIACDFQRVPFHLFSAPDDEAAAEVRKEFTAAQRTGLQANDDMPATFPFRAAALTTLPGQAQFNPLQYVLGLAEVLAAKGCIIHENSRALETEDGEPCVVTTTAGRVTARHIVKATHVPQGIYAVHTAMIPHREYAVLARISKAAALPGIYWSANPAWQYSVRPWNSDTDNYVMVLGESHKPGEQKPGELDRIMQFLHEHFEVEQIAYTWAAQNYQSGDLLPYIGTSQLEKHTWMATGFAADGLVWGTVAGKLISDGIRNIDNPWADTFAATRFTPLASAKNLLKESAAVSKHLLHDLLVYGRKKECEALKPGEGCVVNADGEKIAACRDREGQLHVVSAVCTHMGCLVHWNTMELSWDCPCHGSRFAMDGRVLEGPANKDLAQPVSGVMPGK